MSTITFRTMVEADVPYIKSTFLRSHRNSAFTNFTSDPEYFKFFSPLFENLMFKEGVTVGLAVNPKDSNHIYAWCVWEQLGPVQVLHYVYTKASYRKLDIASALLIAAGFDTDKPFFYTLLSRDGGSLRREFKQAAYNPFILLQAKES